MTVRIINNHYVVQTNNPSQLKAIFPNAKDAVIKGQFYLAVPMDLDAARVLNNLGYKAESPIRTHYDWPGRYTPRWYQLDTAEFFTYHVRAYCHSSMRTGKTLAALWSADYLRQSGKIKRTLIAAPLSTLWDVWEQNIFESFPLRTFCVLHGSRQKRLDLLAEPHDFYIINHDGIKIIEQDLAKRPDIDHFIIDEVDVYRNNKKARGQKHNRWTYMNNVLNKQGIVRSAWGMTGTPTPQSPTDAYYQSKLITPEAYKGNFKSFRMETMFQLKMFKWIPKRGAEESAARIMKPCIRFERSVCTDMEPVFIDRRAQLSKEQEIAYKNLLRKSVADIRGKVVTAVNAAVLLSKLVQTAAGVVYDAHGTPTKMDFGPRLAVLEELIEQNNEKVLVFVPFTGVLDALATELRKRWSVETIDGSVSAGKRTDIFRRFRSGKDPHILLCHPKTMAHGLDLSTASLSIWYAPYMSAGTVQQANARTDGSKQKAKIDIAHIYATSEERKAYEAIRTKGRLQDIVLSLANEKM